MATFTRKNAWTNNGTFDNADLLWYAKGVIEMQSRPIQDPTSWWFYAAIHGEFLLQEITDPQYLYLNWKNIAYIRPAAQLGTPPAQNLTDLFWDQCQHGSWFFPPWHRGYLVALENILRDIIVNQLNGPADWALPYWNYLKQSTAPTEFKIPPAFLSQTLPDGTKNPLYVLERYGPQGNRDIYIEVGANMQTSANDECQWDTIYEESSDGTPGTGNLYGYYYGGGQTGFSHNGDGTGDLEMNPHNFVHGMVGGRETSNNQLGLMGVPNTAALDPVFFLHHANIDRMWAAWIETGKNQNPTDANWLAGPSANGNSRFAMPVKADGTPWYYTPKDVETTVNLKYYGSAYSYTYDDLSLTSFDTTPPEKNVAERLANLGIKGPEKNIGMATKKSEELVGSSTGSLKLTSGDTHTTVQLSPPEWRTVEKSLVTASRSTLPDEIYLQLENVKGVDDSNFLSVYVNQKFAKTISLFGLLQASMENSPHGGNGKTYKINITHIIDDLHLEGAIDVNSLDVQIRTKHNIPDSEAITIGRIGIYRAGSIIS